jgi:hypothetical protein
MYVGRSDKQFYVILFRHRRTLEHPAYRRDVLSDSRLFPALKENLDGHRFKDDRAVETVVTRSLVTRDTDYYRQGLENLSHDVSAITLAGLRGKVVG